MSSYAAVTDVAFGSQTHFAVSALCPLCPQKPTFVGAKQVSRFCASKDAINIASGASKLLDNLVRTKSGRHPSRRTAQGIPQEI